MMTTDLYDPRSRHTGHRIFFLPKAKIISRRFIQLFLMQIWLDVFFQVDTLSILLPVIDINRAEPEGIVMLSTIMNAVSRMSTYCFMSLPVGLEPKILHKKIYTKNSSSRLLDIYCKIFGTSLYGEGRTSLRVRLRHMNQCRIFDNIHVHSIIFLLYTFHINSRFIRTVYIRNQNTIAVYQPKNALNLKLRYAI